jgi:hypothetical protein
MSERTVTTIQYRVIVGKKDPTVAYMQGKLKSTGSTGALFDLLRSGAARTALNRLASRP